MNEPYGPTPQRRATDHPEVLEAERAIRARSTHGRLLVAAAIAVGVLLTGILIGRAFLNEQRDLELCRTLDRFVLTIERGVADDPERTPEERAAVLKLYEDFRDDLDCRTDGGP